MNDNFMLQRDFTKEIANRLKAYGHGSKALFHSGLPRTGSTLIEQILSSFTHRRNIRIAQYHGLCTRAQWSKV